MGEEPAPQHARVFPGAGALREDPDGLIGNALSGGDRSVDLCVRERSSDDLELRSDASSREEKERSRAVAVELRGAASPGGDLSRKDEHEVGPGSRLGDAQSWERLGRASTRMVGSVAHERALPPDWA